MAMMRRAQFAIGLLVTTVVSALAPIPPVRFPSLSPLPILPDENALLREFVSIDFVSINNEDAPVLPDPSCNSDRLRAVLEQSISDSTTLSLLAILGHISEGHFAANCTRDSAPELDRRPHFCQVTIGRTTCAVATGPQMNDDPPETVLRAAHLFHPRPLNDRPAREAAMLPGLLALLRPPAHHATSKKLRSEGLI